MAGYAIVFKNVTTSFSRVYDTRVPDLSWAEICNFFPIGVSHGLISMAGYAMFCKNVTMSFQGYMIFVNSVFSLISRDCSIYLRARRVADSFPAGHTTVCYF